MFSKKYLTDTTFLHKLDLLPVKEQNCKIIILDWNENPIKDYTGLITGGSINIDGSSSLRRTASLEVFTEKSENPIENIEHDLSLNKKVSIEIGYKNITNDYPEHKMIWFPMGVYVITSCSLSHSADGVSISLNLQDKMCLLNGTCGGTLAASVIFNEKEEIDDQGNITITYPTIYQILHEAVHHWGGEQTGKIIIKDIDTKIKKVMKWNGNIPMYLYKDDSNTIIDITTSELIATEERKEVYSYEEFLTTDNCYIKYNNGDDIGYIYTDFIYTNGELSSSIGSPITEILDKIRDTLGNYEYFYDLDGNFVFQEIKNYLNTSKSTVDLNEMKANDYLINRIAGDSVYEFNDSKLIVSYSNNPKYEMIKNDFVVWGIRKTVDGLELPIRYRLSIDDKPDLSKQVPTFVYRYKELNSKGEPVGHFLTKKVITYDSHKDISTLPAGNSKYIYFLRKLVTTDKNADTKSYVWESDVNQSSVQDFSSDFVSIDGGGLLYTWGPVVNEDKTTTYKYIQLTDDVIQKEEGKILEVIPTDWRTALYLQGLEAEDNSTDSNYYYPELSVEWPKIYDIWADEPDFYPEFKRNKSDGDYFLDFIDTTSAIGDFSISNIGRRTYTINDSAVNCLFPPSIPDLIIIKGDSEDTTEKRNECVALSLPYVQVKSNIYNSLAGGGSRYSAFESIQDLLYQYTNYNEEVSLTCLPLYHLDVNTRITINDPASNIAGDYIIKTISIPLDLEETMSITASRALERI